MEQTGEKKPPEQATLVNAHADLLSLWSALGVEDRRFFLRQIKDAAEASRKVVQIDELLLHRNFREEAESIARGTGISLSEIALAVNPHHYESYTASSDRCRIDRYLTRAGDVDLRVQAFTTVELMHKLIPRDFVIHVLAGEAVVHRNNFGLPYGSGTVLDCEPGPPLQITLGANARILYVGFPLTAWADANIVRSK